MPTPSKWFNSDVTLHAGKMTELAQYIPSFDRCSFALGASNKAATRANDRLDTIVRLPIGDDRDHIPVGVGSKDYALLQHSSVFDEALKAPRKRKDRSRNHRC